MRPCPVGRDNDHGRAVDTAPGVTSEAGSGPATRPVGVMGASAGDPALVVDPLPAREPALTLETAPAWTANARVALGAAPEDALVATTTPARSMAATVANVVRARPARPRSRRWMVNTGPVTP